MRKRLVDMEEDLKKSIEKDINDPEVFNKIKELAYAYLVRNKMLTWYYETDEVSLLIAEDLYMKILSGSPIYSWIGYISKSAIGYIRKFRKMTQSEIIDTTGNSGLLESVVSMSCSGSLSVSNARYSEILDKMSLESIPSKIEEVMEESCRYYRDTSQWLNTYISVILTLINNGNTVSFNLNSAESMYLNIIIAKVRDAVSYEIKQLVEFNDFNLTPLKLFELEEGCSDSNEE